jgi:hypothetical protein
MILQLASRCAVNLLRIDALDRFGTRDEQGLTQYEVVGLLIAEGFRLFDVLTENHFGALRALRYEHRDKLFCRQHGRADEPRSCG